MLGYIARRILFAIPIAFGVSVVCFSLVYLAPGDPLQTILPSDATAEMVEQIKHAYGLDRPLPVQYVILMKKLFITRDLTSYSTQGELVVPAIVAATPVTLSLVLGAAVIWVVVAMLMGVAAAVLRGTVFDPLLMVLALIGISMPVFWLGEMANLVTQSRYHDTVFFSWVPPLGYTPFAQDPFMWFKHLVIPWLVLSALYIGLYARVLRADLLENEHEDYVRTARSKGLTERRVLLRHTLRTSMITFVSLFGLDFGVLVGGGALLVEVVFGLPGVGLLTYQSLTSLDLPVIMATVIYGAFFIVLVNAFVDVAYAWLDPRVRPA
jgi:peptide/nickel transport system permease protein